jgi:hypothetical protein
MASVEEGQTHSLSRYFMAMNNKLSVAFMQLLQVM